MATALNTNPAALEKGAIYAFPLGFAMEKFNEEIKVGRNLEVRLAQNDEVTNVQD